MSLTPFPEADKGAEVAKLCCEVVLKLIVYLKAPRPWEKMTTGHFPFDLNGASK